MHILNDYDNVMISSSVISLLKMCLMGLGINSMYSLHPLLFFKVIGHILK